MWGEGSNNYKFMQTMREELSDNEDGACTYMESGVYVGASPTRGGNLTYALYSDSSCEYQLSSSKYSVDDYLSSESNCGS